MHLDPRWGTSGRNQASWIGRVGGPWTKSTEIWKSSQNLCALTPLCPNSSLVKYTCPTSSPAIPRAPPQSPSLPSQRILVSSIPLLHPSLKLDKIQLQGHLWDPSPFPPPPPGVNMFSAVSRIHWVRNVSLPLSPNGCFSQF